MCRLYARNISKYIKKIKILSKQDKYVIAFLML